MTEATPYWTVAQTIASHESAVSERLLRCGYDVLAPRGRFRVNGVHKEMPVFPGYVFLHVTDGRWYDARWTMGVLRLIMSGEQPARLPDFEIQKIKNATGKNGLVRLPKNPPTPPRTKIVEGSTVRILTGNFRGINAVYQGMSVHERHMVLLALFGRPTLTELAKDDHVITVDFQKQG